MISEEEFKSARMAALRLLKFGPRSEKELRRKLTDKGFPEELQDLVLTDLKTKGFINDAKLANLFAAHKSGSKPVGKRLILAQLKAKGIDAGVAQQAVESQTAGQDEYAVVRALAEQRFSRMQGLTREAAQRRLLGFLGRRGFSSDLVYRVVRELTNEVAR